jgi:hypothetical protein
MQWITTSFSMHDHHVLSFMERAEHEFGGTGDRQQADV